jgi:hypothetical protein
VVPRKVSHGVLWRGSTVGSPLEGVQWRWPRRGDNLESSPAGGPGELPRGVPVEGSPAGILFTLWVPLVVVPWRTQEWFPLVGSTLRCPFRGPLWGSLGGCPLCGLPCGVSPVSVPRAGSPERDPLSGSPVGVPCVGSLWGVISGWTPVGVHFGGTHLGRISLLGVSCGDPLWGSTLGIPCKGSTVEVTGRGHHTCLLAI